MPRTVRPGWSPARAARVGAAAAAALAALAAGCADDDGGGGVDPDDPSATTVDTTPATLPESVEPGRGAMVIDGSGHALTVRACELEPTTDPETGVTTVLAVDADDGVGTSVSVTRSITEGAVPTTTDSITVVDTEQEGMVASRAEVGGRFVDLLAEGALTPMLDVDGDVVTGEGVLGPRGARPGDPRARDVQLLLRCPPAG